MQFVPFEFAACTGVAGMLADSNKKPRTMPGLEFAGRPRGSVTRGVRCAVTAAEAVVEAHGDHIHVLADPVAG
jgi:hypothetical protein